MAGTLTERGIAETRDDAVGTTCGTGELGMRCSVPGTASD